MCFGVDFVPIWRGQMMGTEDGPARSPSQGEGLLTWPRTPHTGRDPGRSQPAWL